MQNLDLKDWENGIKQDKNAVIIDVRSAEEYETGHIPGAQQINVQSPQDFMAQIADLDKSTDYYVYCKSGNRSLQACQVLDFNGFSNIYSLEGGFENWKNHHTPD